MTQSFAKELRQTMADAERAQTHRAHAPAGFDEPTAYIPVPAARSLLACMKTTKLAANFGSDGRLRRVPKGEPAGSTITMSAAVAGSSRVAGAGARIFVLPDNRKAHAAGQNTLAMETVLSEFRTIESAVFGTVDIDSEGDAPTISLPVSGADMDMKNAIVKGVRFEIPRSERRRIDADQLVEEIEMSLALGIARVADEVLCTAILAAIDAANAAATAEGDPEPGPFSLGAAAARGLEFQELRALVGTDAIGATVTEGAQLRAAGIPAEMTPDMAPSLVGAFNRAGVIIADDISVHFERLGSAGRLAVTAWVNALPLVPDPSMFWTAS